MNLSAPFLIEFFGKDMDAAFPYMDIVFGNETEAETFGRVKGAGVRDVHACMRMQGRSCAAVLTLCHACERAVGDR